MQVALNRPQVAAMQALVPGNTVTTAFGRGVGKSHLQEIFWLTTIAAWEHVPRPKALDPFMGIRHILLTPSFKQAVDVHATSLERKLKTDWAFLGGRINHSKWIVTFPGGSWIQFFGAENADAARGMRCDAVTGDECDDIPISTWEAIAQPWLSEPWSLKMRLLGGTPRKGRHGLLYKSFKLGQEPEREPRHYSFHATYRDAPETVDQEEVERIRRTTNETLFAREWEASFESGQGLVYPMFSNAFHVREPPPGVQWTKILVGGDAGWNDPGVFLVIGVLGHGADTICHVIREVYATERTQTWWLEQAKIIDTLYPNAFWYYEHKPEFIAEAKRIGIRMEPANKERGLGVQSVADAVHVREDTEGFRWAQLYVSPACPNTIAEFGLYSYRRDPRDRERFLDDIDDTKNDHCLVAGTMVETDSGPRAIEVIQAGENVLTRAGFRSVVAGGMTSLSEPIWRLECSDGTALEGTANHRVWTTNREWVRLDSLRYGDMLLPCERDQLTPKKSCLRDERIGGTRPRSTRRTAATSPAPVRVESSTPTGKSASVYCLTVDQDHEFFANGILVRNCMDSLRYALFSHFGVPDRRITTGYGTT